MQADRSIHPILRLLHPIIRAMWRKNALTPGPIAARLPLVLAASIFLAALAGAPRARAQEGGGVSIDVFKAVPETINPDAMATLVWKTSRAVTCAMDRDGVPVTFPIDLPDGQSPQMAFKKTTTFIMTCVGPVMPARSSATVTVRPPPSIDFTADPTTVAPGQATALSWTTKNADSCTLDPGAEPVPVNSGAPVEKKPMVTTTYSLTCAGTGPDASKSQTVTVSQVSIGSLTAQPSGPVDPHTKVTLSWTVENATGDCTLDPGSIAVPGKDGSKDVSPSATTTYSLSCPGGGGPARKSHTITVNPVQITNFSSKPSGDVGPNTKLTLSWTIKAASGDCALTPGLGSVPGASGSKDVTIEKTTTYGLTCPGQDGPATKQQTVTVPNVKINAFTATPSAIDPGAPFTLSWDVSYAGGPCTIQPGGHQAAIPKGTLALKDVTQETTYTMSCPGVGNPATAATKVTINPLAITSFTAAPCDGGTPGKCPTPKPGAETTLSWETTGAQSCTLNGAAVNSPNGSQKITPQVCTTYQLSCSAGGKQKSAKILVSPEGGLCLSSMTGPDWGFSRPDSRVQINWIVTNAKDNQCTLSGGGLDKPRTVPTYPFDQAFASAPVEFGWNTFTLDCKGATVGEDSATHKVCGILNGPSPPPGTCPTAQ